ncbi:MAG: CO dehydrogenase/acetyl-CoA synthase complex subunit epsilon [ANME-2 cluster archaeon]|jgi:acetyl-CoA decarbonylase/synthase complex subunit alpha|nr:MAG: CO dehydrogenase/acetyl-CoA synthase complex subunit epsilon [ANME-2 cluster archaeon]
MIKDGRFILDGMENVVINIGKVTTEEELAEQEWEPMGPTPKPGILSLRNWDHRLLKDFPPFYAPICDMCCLCTYGKCDLTGDRKGACGIDIAAQQARMVTIACCIGTAAHAGHANHVLHELIKWRGRDHPIDLGPYIDVEAPIIRTVVGTRPKTLGDLEGILDYVNQQLVHVLSSTHTGQEGSFIDFESKALHVSMIDNLAKEVADIAQIAGFDFPRGDPDAALIDFGFGAVDRTKPIIVFIGHYPAVSVATIDYIEEHGLSDKIEVCGICCTAIETSRYSASAKVIGPLSMQLFFVRSGIADVIVLDEQCVRTDLLEEAQKVGAPLILTTDKICYNLPDVTNRDSDKVVEDLLNGAPGVLISDPHKAAKVITETALKMKPKRDALNHLPELEEVRELAEACIECGWCDRACPNSLPVKDAMIKAKEGDFEGLSNLFSPCMSCGRCESECKKDLPIVSMILKSAQEIAFGETYTMRAGRGPVLDTEIRKVGAPLVLGEIPGIVALVGCSNFPDGEVEVAKIAEEFARRNYIVVATGCSAMAMAMYRCEDGQTLYEKYPGTFDAGGVVNIGSCVANAHIIGAAIKVAAIFARIPLRGNFEEIADYILNKVGACGVAWGAMSQKAASIGTGTNRWGIPVVLGPHGSKYRRAYISNKELSEWELYDKRTGEVVEGEPAPEHLAYPAETMEEAIVLIAKLCIRPSDNAKGRQIKLSNYVDLYKKYMETLPPDLHLFVRNERDIPITMKDEIMEYLEEAGWEPRKAIGDPSRLVPEEEV